MEHLLLLHGALGSKQQFDGLSQQLKSFYQVHVIDFIGHGNIDFVDDFSIPTFAKQIISYLERNDIPSINIFGYSMGGYVALYLAKHYPEKVKKIITLATKFSWSPEIAQREVKMLDPIALEAKVPDFADELKSRHGEYKWKRLLKETSDLMLDLGNNSTMKTDDYLSIEQPVLIGLGDRDKMVSLEESLEVYKKIKNAGFYMLPHTKHPFESVDIKRLSFEISNFI